MVNHQLAGLGERFLALIIDNIILIIIGFIVGFVIGLIVPNLSSLGTIISFIIGVGYYYYYWAMKDGVTIGNSVMHIRVVKADGSPITFATALLRYIGYIINTLIFFLGWLYAFIDGQKRGLHDIISGTIVVKA